MFSISVNLKYGIRISRKLLSAAKMKMARLVLNLARPRNRSRAILL